MSTRLVEGGIAAGFGAVDTILGSKTGTTGFGGPLNQKWALVFELVGLGAGVFGRKVGLSTEVRAPLTYSALAMLGARGARYGMAGNLLKPGAWAGMGGEGGDGDTSNIIPMATGGAAPQGPALKVRGGVGGYPTYPPTAEAPGIAG